MTADSFFSAYPEFFNTGMQPYRLGARYEAIIARHADLIKGKTVLDLGSHDGRWAFAALKAGARKVVCIEGRQELVSAADKIFQRYGIESDTYEMHVGEGLRTLRDRRPKCDVVLLLGIYYHIHNHLEWVDAIRRTGATEVIVDTGLTPCDGDFDNVVRFKVEDSHLHTSSPYETFEGYNLSVGGHPSRAFVNFSFRVFGYQSSEIDWTPLLRHWGTKGLEDYAEDRRATFLARRIK